MGLRGNVGKVKWDCSRIPGLVVYLRVMKDNPVEPRVTAGVWLGADLVVICLVGTFETV